MSSNHPDDHFYNLLSIEKKEQMKAQSLRITTLSFLLLTLLCGNVLADFNAAGFVAGFNSLNNGYGYRFSHSSTNLEDTLIQASGTQNIDKSAYNASLSTTGSNYIRSFCIEPSQIMTSIYNGKLNYNSATGQTKNSEGKALNIGVAYLYSQFAAGTLADYRYMETENNGSGSNRGADAAYLKLAIQQLLGYQGSPEWGTNAFLGQLLQINSDRNYWLSSYDPNQYYDVIGDYAVFAMNVYTSGGVGRQDFLYVTKTDNGNGGDVPEPATILLWSLGGLGATAASWRKRNCNKMKLR